MRNSEIMVFDSGIGGLGTLFELKKVMPTQNFLYVADFLNAPYGNRPKKEIEKIVLETIGTYIKKLKPKCVVIACNTATCVCVQKIREVFKGVFVVGCEPAVNLAEKENKKNILVLCTKATKKYCLGLKKHKNITVYSPQKLAFLVDNFFFDEEKITKYLNKSLKRFAFKFDAAILGCTHYSLVKQKIEKVLGAKAFDGNASIAKYVQKNFVQNGGEGKITFVSTKKQKKKYLKDCYKKIKGEEICVE